MATTKTKTQKDFDALIAILLLVLLVVTCGVLGSQNTGVERCYESVKCVN